MFLILRNPLNLKASISQNGKTHSNNLSTVADELFEYVRPFCEVGAERINLKKCS